MAGLKDTTAKLLRMRRQWEKLASAAAKAGSEAARTDTATPLRETSNFGSNPGQLRMWSYVPESLEPGAGLVVALHGCTQNAAGFDQGTGWSGLADRYGFALLMPEQQHQNNPNNCFNWFSPTDTKRGQGEPLSILQMVERMISDHSLDRGRVYVTGLSAGGAMAAVMLATYPDIFSGGAILAGLPYGAAEGVQEALDAMYQGRVKPAARWADEVRRASRHTGPWPKVSIWHGTADTTVTSVNARELVKQWTDLHGLGDEPDAKAIVDGQSHSVWRDRSGRAVVESYTISGMAHGLPIGGPATDEEFGEAGPFFLDAGISSSYRIAQFFDLTGTVHAPSRVVPIAPKRQASAAPATSFSPETIISDALRKAGLLKR